MSRTWNATFEAEPAGGDQGSTLDNKARETRSEIRKRMDTLVDNWATDPDTPADLDLSDDAVLAEHISGLVSTGAVDMDNIPEGTTKGGVFVFDGNAEAPAGDFNGSGDAIVRVKEAITFLPTSGTIECAGVEYAYTSVTVADKEFNLSGTLSASLSEDDPVYVKTGSDRPLMGGRVSAIKDQGNIATAGLKTKVLEIGDWNMYVGDSGSDTKNVAHGMGADWKKIRVINTVIRNDADNEFGTIEAITPGSTGNQIGIKFNSTNIVLDHYNIYSDTDHNATSYNRGWITLWYEA